MKLLPQFFLSIQNIASVGWKDLLDFTQRIGPNGQETWKWFVDIIVDQQDSRKKLGEYFRWHLKEVLFCCLLAFLISSVDKVQQFFASFARDIIGGAPSLLYFTLAFIGNGLVIFWLCYVFWHKPKRTTLLIGLLGRKRAESYKSYYKTPGHVWRVSSTAAMPLLLAGAGLAQSIIRYHAYASDAAKAPTLLLKFVKEVNSNPLVVLFLITLCFLLLNFLLMPRTPQNTPLKIHEVKLWKNFLLVVFTILGLLILFWFYHEFGPLYKVFSLVSLVFAPPLVLTYLLNGFSECLVESNQLMEVGTKEEIVAAKRFSKTYDFLMWFSYLCSGIALILFNMKNITTNEWFSIIVYPVAMLIFIAIAYYQAIDWLSYNMSPSRFYSLIGIVFGLVLFGPQKHYEIKYKAPSVAGEMKRASMEKYFLYWFKDRLDHKIMGDSANLNVYLVATEGGGSRAGAWTSAVLTGLDEAMQGKFQQQCFAISGVSGGSIGTAATLALWDNARILNIPPQTLYANDRIRAEYIGRIFNRNYISTALAGLFISDGLQQNIFFSWLFPNHYSRTDRHQDEESDAVRLGLQDVFGPESSKVLAPRYLKETDFLGLYYQNEEGMPRIGLPLFFPNTCRVEEGRRGVASPTLLNPKPVSNGPKNPGNAGLLDIIGAKDRAGKANRRLSLGEVASLSELFPFVNSTVYMGDSVGTFMDGGVYENMGLTTLYEVGQALLAIQQSPDQQLLHTMLPDSIQRKDFVLLLGKVKLKLLFIYNTEHPDHYQNPKQSRTVQFFDPLTTLLHTPFGGHTDYIYHKTKIDFGDANVTEFPLLLLKRYEWEKYYARNPGDPIVMSRWLSRYEMQEIMDSAGNRVREKLPHMLH